jgi:hypothetical protein
MLKASGQGYIDNIHMYSIRVRGDFQELSSKGVSKWRMAKRSFTRHSKRIQSGSSATRRGRLALWLKHAFVDSHEAEMPSR